MFWPNSVKEVSFTIHSSHRTKKFREKYVHSVNKFKSTFDLEDFDILIVPGSWSLWVECVMRSLSKNIEVLWHPWKFTKRRETLAKQYNSKHKEWSIWLYAHLETSINKWFEHTDPAIVDAISSFPYRTIPDNAKIFVTTLNKQLWWLAGVSIIGVRKDSWHLIKQDDSFSYCNLFKYKDTCNTWVVVTTFPEYIIDDLLKVLEIFTIDQITQKINKVSWLLIERFDLDRSLLWCPVIMITKEKIPYHIAKEYDLYWLDERKDHYSLFTYSHPLEDYEEFLSVL